MSTNTQPEARSVSFQHFGTPTRALPPTYWFTRARKYQIHRGDVKHPKPALFRGSDPGLIDLPISRRIELATSRTYGTTETLTAFLNPMRSVRVSAPIGTPSVLVAESAGS